MKRLLVILCIFTSLSAFGQISLFTPVQDKPNEGQLRRMVFQQWNDWQPNPTTTWIGLPKDPAGWLYWDVLNHSYYKGSDRRPYRINGGPETLDFASLIGQSHDDKKIDDSMKEVFNTHILTYVNMSGGDADIAYSMYFKNVFDKLTTAITFSLSGFAAGNPKAFNLFVDDSMYAHYTQYLDIEKSRIGAIHQMFVDKGARIIDYLKIENELEHENAIIFDFMQTCVNLANIPTPQEVMKLVKTPPIQNNDKKIVQHILGTWSF